MKLKNVSNKVIVIGEEVFLPNDGKEIPESYRDNPVVKYYLRQGFMADTARMSVSAEEMQNATLEARAEIEKYRREAEAARAEAEAARAEAKAAREKAGKAKTGSQKAKKEAEPKEPVEDTAESPAADPVSASVEG